MNDLTAAIIALGAVTAVFGGWWRWGWPRYVAIRITLKEFRDSVLGRPPVLHPDTGEQLLPAVPGIGARQANIEGQLEVLNSAVISLTQTTAALANQAQRLDDHERRLGILEEARDERTLARTETVELLRVMDTAMKTPPPPPESE